MLTQMVHFSSRGPFDWTQRRELRRFKVTPSVPSPALFLVFCWKTKENTNMLRILPYPETSLVQKGGVRKKPRTFLRKRQARISQKPGKRRTGTWAIQTFALCATSKASKAPAIVAFAALYAVHFITIRACPSGVSLLWVHSKGAMQ